MTVSGIVEVVDLSALPSQILEAILLTKLRYQTSGTILVSNIINSTL